MDPVQQEADKLYKAHFGKMVASLLYSFRDIDPEAAEDLVHDAFSAALTTWRLQGVPLNSAGWIYKVCRNKALNQLKKDKRTEALNDHADTRSAEIRFSESVLDDQSLKLLFACAHPDLSPKVQLVITLKYVANLKVEAIAGSLAMTIDGVDKLLLRARQKIKDEKILLEEPAPQALNARLASVHKVIYLIFNEGYKSSWGTEILREELCEEALLINKALLDSTLGNEETMALHALMLFSSARFRSRFGPSGELIDLENQDRTLWNKELIALASRYLHQSRSDTVSTYHLEASIACLHCMAESFHTTNWKTIAALYAQLLHGTPNPFIALNHAIALYHAGEKSQSFDILHDLQRHPFLGQYYLLNTALGKFHHLEGNDATAKEYLLKAQRQTSFEKEKAFIQKMIDRIDLRYEI
jgi:RNA polymerase sigma-70 factor (ECF subfamily)